MRVNSWELPFSAIPLCQLFPCHLRPTRPTLCINLYVKNLSWLHHWRVPHGHTCDAFFPSEWGSDPQCQAAQLAHWTWWWQCLVAWHCRSVWLLSCHSVADTVGLALSMSKSHWHGALHSAHKSYTRGQVSWKRGSRKRELVAALWTSSRQFSQVLWLKVHSH